MDALLIFDCLLYINFYYMFMFTIANLGIWVTKYADPNFETPSIDRDAYVAATLTIAEVVKLLLFRKFRDLYQGLAIVSTVVLTLISIAAVLYVLIIQYPILKLEMCLDTMFCVLLCSELVFGIYTFLPCCNPDEY